MATVQYVIDSICSSVTVECVFKMIEGLSAEGPFKVSELVPLIQSKDRSLDPASAGLVARAAVEDMAQRHLIRITGEEISRAS